MQIYYANLDAISQTTMQLDQVLCLHCGKVGQLVSHGFIYRKQAVATAPIAVGKRILCARRYQRTGCGRTVQLMLATMLRYLHVVGSVMVTFMSLLAQGMSIAKAYQQSAGTLDSRHAYRWLTKLFARLSHYRTVAAHASHVRDLAAPNSANSGVPPTRRHLLACTLTLLTQHFGVPLCASYQLASQCAFC